MRDAHITDAECEIVIAEEGDHSRTSHLVVLAGGQPGRARARRRAARRIAAVSARTAERSFDYSTEWQFGEPPADLAGHELCSAHFVSGAGWAWRLTAALSRSREAKDAAPCAPAEW